jgi:hypothetical protein
MHDDEEEEKKWVIDPVVGQASDPAVSPAIDHAIDPAEERRLLVIARRDRVHGIGVRREGVLCRKFIVTNIPRNLVPINPAGYGPINM